MTAWLDDTAPFAPEPAVAPQTALKAAPQAPAPGPIAAQTKVLVAKGAPALAKAPVLAKPKVSLGVAVKGPVMLLLAPVAGAGAGAGAGGSGGVPRPPQAKKAKTAQKVVAAPAAPGGGGAASPPPPSSRARTAFQLFSRSRRASLTAPGAAPAEVKAAMAAAWEDAPSPVVTSFMLAECNEQACLESSGGKSRAWDGGVGSGGGVGGKKKKAAKKARRGDEEGGEEEEEEDGSGGAATAGGEAEDEDAAAVAASEEEEEEEEGGGGGGGGGSSRWRAPAPAADERAAAASRFAASAAAGRAPTVLPSGAVEEGEARCTRANCMPRVRGSFNYAPFTFAVGTRVGVVLPALYDWTAELAAGEGGAAGGQGLATLQLLQDRGALTPLKPLHGATRTGVLWGTAAVLQEVREAGSGGGGGGGGAAGAKRAREAPGGSRGWHLLRVTLDAAATAAGGFTAGAWAAGGGGRRRGGGGGGAEGEEGGGGGQLPHSVTIPWLPPAHPLINAPFVITWEAYAAATAAAPRPGTQVRMLFAPEAGEGTGGGRWHEGRVYAHTARTAERACGWAATHYKSSRVVWYDQLASGPWVLEALQTDNDVSPWELCTRSPFVPPGVRAAFAAPPPELASPAALLSHLLTTEPAALFKALPTPEEAPTYRERVKTPLTLPALLEKARKGGYAGAAAGALWEDLRTLITNAKTFNQRYTLAWRCADALEAEVRRVRKAGFDARSAAAAAAEGGEEEKGGGEEEGGGGGGGDGGGGGGRSAAGAPPSPTGAGAVDPWEASWEEGAFSQGLFSQEFEGGEEDARSPLLGAGGASPREPRGFGAYSRPGAASMALSRRMVEEEGGGEEEEQ